MIKVFEGIYRNGAIQLHEQPPLDMAGGRAVVVFVDDISAKRDSANGTDEEREALLKEMFEDMDRGHHFGGHPYGDREELYDRNSGR